MKRTQRPRESELQNPVFWVAEMRALVNSFASAIGSGVPEPFEDDLRVVANWLVRYSHDPRTFRSYLKETSQFLLWLILIRQTHLVALSKCDLDEYLRFVEAPPSEWVGKRLPRTHPDWRPFASNEPADATLRLKRMVLHNFFGVLAEENVMPRDLGRALPSLMRTPVKSFSRALSDNAIWLLLEAAHMQRTLRKCARARFLVILMTEAGLSASEIAQARTDDITESITGDHLLVVKGRLGHPRTVRLTSHVVEEMRMYRTTLNMASEIHPDDSSPLVHPCTGKERNLCENCVVNEVVALLRLSASLAAERGMTEDADALSHASPTWLQNNLSAALTNRARQLQDALVLAGQIDPSSIPPLPDAKRVLGPTGHPIFDAAPREIWTHGWFVTQWSGGAAKFDNGNFFFVFSFVHAECISFVFSDIAGSDWQADALVELTRGRPPPAFLVTDDSQLVAMTTMAGARLSMPTRAYLDPLVTLMPPLLYCIHMIGPLLSSFDGSEQLSEIDQRLDTWRHWYNGHADTASSRGAHRFP